MANPSTRRYPATRSEREHAAKNPVPALRNLSKRGPLLAGQVLLAADPDAATHQAFGVPAFDFVEGDAALWPFRFTMQQFRSDRRRPKAAARTAYRSKWPADEEILSAADLATGGSATRRAQEEGLETERAPR